MYGMRRIESENYRKCVAQLLAKSESHEGGCDLDFAAAGNKLGFVRNILEPRNKRDRKSLNYFRAAQTGKIPWNARGIDECVRHLNTTHASLTDEHRKEWDATVEALFYIKQKYGENRGSLYFIRMGHILSFLTHYKKRLEKDKLVWKDESGTLWWTDHLANAFAKLQYTMRSFRYDEVKRYVQSCEKPS